MGSILEFDERELLGSPTLDALTKVYDEIYHVFKTNNLMLSVRDQFMGALFGHLADRLFNDVLRIPSLCVMPTAFRIQIVVTSLENWSNSQGGNALKAVCADQLKFLKQLALLLLVDKPDLTYKKCQESFPEFNIFQMEHLMTTWNNVPDNRDFKVPVATINELKELRKAEEKKTEPDKLKGSLYLDSNHDNLDLRIQIGHFTLATVSVPADLVQSNPSLAFLNDEDDDLTI